MRKSIRAGLAPLSFVFGVSVLFSAALPRTASAGAAESFARGVREFQNRDFQAAAKDLQASMDAKPSAATAVYLGNAYLELGELDAAKAAFEQVLKLEPNHPKRAAIQTLILSIDAHAEVRVHVESTPPGATVFIDSEATGPRGTTPLDLNVLVGHHTILLQLDTYGTESTEVDLVAGKPPAPVAVTMHGPGCDLALSVRGPAGGQASVDGAPPVPVPAKAHVRYGEHTVHFTADAYEPGDVKLACDGRTALEVAPLLMPRQGRLLLPQGARVVVRVDGQLVDMTGKDPSAGYELAPGRHTISVTEGDEPERTTVLDVGAGQVVQLGLPSDDSATGAFPKRALYLDVFGGGNLALRDWQLGANAFQAQNGTVRLAPQSGPAAGLRVGLQATPRLAFETEVAWLSLPNSLDTSQGLFYGVDGLWHVMRTPWTPLVEAGAGVYQVVSGKLGSDFSVRGHLGVGVRGRLSRWLAVRADVRDVVSKGFSGPSDNLELFAGAEALLF